MVQQSAQNLMGNRANVDSKPETKAFIRCCWLYFVAFFILPDMCGFYFMMLFSAKRIMMFVLYFLIFSSKRRMGQFFNYVKKLKAVNLVVILYMAVRLFVAIYRVDINTFMGEFVDGVMVLYLFYYIIKTTISFDKLVRFIEIALTILCVLGLLEFVTGFNAFSLLHFTSGMNFTVNMRLGSVRISGNCRHAIIYGVYITILFCFCCIDCKHNRIFLFRKPVLFVLTTLNVFMTGSRGPTGIFMATIFMFIFLSKKDDVIKSIVILLFIVIIMGIVTALTIRTEFGRYIMRSITSAIDGVLGTDWSVAYGGARYQGSSQYREALKKVFKLTYFNPFVGRGISYGFSVVIDGYWLISCDNAYIWTYIALAYPGLIMLIVFLLAMGVYMVLGMFKYKDRKFAALLIALIGYACNIYVVAFMGSFMYMWMLFGVALYLYNQIKEKKKKEMYNAESNN